MVANATVKGEVKLKLIGQFAKRRILPDCEKLENGRQMNSDSTKVNGYQKRDAYRKSFASCITIQQAIIFRAKVA